MIDFNGEVLAVHTSTLIGIVSLTLLLLYHRMKPKFPSGIPCPESHHIFGFIPFLLKIISRYPSETTKLCFRHNRTWGAPLPRIPGLSLPPIHLYLFHEDNVKYVLQDNFENYEKGDWLRGLFGDFLGGGIFAADGKVWKNHRKVMSTMFSRNLLRFSATVTRQKLQQILSDMETKISSHSKQGTAPLQIDLKDLMMRLTFDLTTKVAFGVDLNTVSADCSSGHNAYFKAFDAVSYQSFNRLTMKDILWPLKKKLGIGSEKRMKECLDILDNFTKNLISERRTNIKNGIHNPSIKRYDDGDYDLLTQYIVRAQKEGVEVSDQELRDIILNVSLAGRDTTAAGLTWAFYELERNPTAKEKVIREVQSICGNGEDADYSFDTMNELQYTHCVLLETLRLHPPVTITIRFAVKSDTLPDGTSIVPGAGVNVHTYAMARSVDIWGDDAAKFRPERHMGKKDPSVFRYPVFHAGPRACIGRPLAMLTMKMTLSMMLTSPIIDFKDTVGHSGEYEPGITTSMKGAFPVSIFHRTHCSTGVENKINASNTKAAETSK